MELFDDDELGFSFSRIISVPMDSEALAASMQSRLKLAPPKRVVQRTTPIVKRVVQRTTPIVKRVVQRTTVAPKLGMLKLKPADMQRRFQSFGEVLSRTARDLNLRSKPGDSSPAYRHLCANAAVGGSSGVALLKQILELVRLQSTRALATSEHNVLNNTQAFRREVLRQLSMKIRRKRPAQY